MRTIPTVEAKAKFSALIAAAEAGEEIAITRHGKVVARLVPDKPSMAADLFRPLWDETDIDIELPKDMSPEPLQSID